MQQDGIFRLLSMNVTSNTDVDEHTITFNKRSWNESTDAFDAAISTVIITIPSLGTGYFCSNNSSDTLAGRTWKARDLVYLHINRPSPGGSGGIRDISMGVVCEFKEFVFT